MQAQVHLEADQVAVQARRPLQVLEVVLARGQEGCVGHGRLAAVELGPPALLEGFQPLDAPPPPHLRAGRDRQLQQRLVQPAAREAEGREGQGRLGGAATRHQPDPLDGDRAQPHGVQPQGLEVAGGFSADELAAHLVVWPGLALDQRHVSALARQQARQGRAGGPAAGDQDLGSHPNTFETHRRKGNQSSILAPLTPASASSSSQSSRLNARRMETGPSWRTK